MKKYSQISILLLVIIITVSISNCGYKPSSKYAKEILGNKISTSIVISQTDPQNSLIVKDAVDKAIIAVFHASLVERRYATTHLVINMSTPSYSPLQYNTDGFIIAYRAKITLMISRESKDLKKIYTSRGTYDFSVVPNSVLTDKERFDAIKFSSFKAISAFITQVSAEGSQVK
ncbi:MAG: hypothetical protein DSZ04_04740 [Sulfurimonas sp.]|nr:MAG: hypothetical protein DSZ04_04740 [Sulfurimonas sp.]